MHAKTREKVAGREWWSDEKTLLAHIANQQSIGNWLWLQSKVNDTVPRPELITLPGQQSEKPVVVSPSRRRYLERLRLNQGSTTKDGDS